MSKRCLNASDVKGLIHDAVNKGYKVKVELEPDQVVCTHDGEDWMTVQDGELSIDEQGRVSMYGCRVSVGSNVVIDEEGKGKGRRVCSCYISSDNDVIYERNKSDNLLRIDGYDTIGEAIANGLDLNNYKNPVDFKGIPYMITEEGKKYITER